MKIHSPIPILVSAAGVLAIGAALTAAPAMAASAQGCTGAACSVDGSVVVLASITLSMPTTSFTDGTLAAGTTSPNPMQTGTGQFTANVVSGDSHGMTLTAVAGTDFTAPSGNTIPASALTIFEGGNLAAGNPFSGSNGGTSYVLPEPGATPVSLGGATGPTAAGGQNFAFATDIAVPASAGAGAYVLPINFAAIGS